jgi:hypothetical protein
VGALFVAVGLGSACVLALGEDFDQSYCGGAPLSCPAAANGVCPSSTMTCGAMGCSGWASWPMPNPVNAGLPNQASYDRSSTLGVVKDNVTKLWWQDPVGGANASSVNCSGGCSQDQASAYCANLVLAGYCDWRLPTRIELVSLIDFTQAPPIDPGSFGSLPSVDAFWTSSLVNVDTPFAYYVDFSDTSSGGPVTVVSVDPGTEQHNARCVRGGQSTQANHYATPPDAGDAGTVQDTATGLTWYQGFSPTTYSWSDAPGYCTSLPNGKWRLPSLRELQTIYDDSRWNDQDAGPGSVDPIAFPGLPTPPECFWTSSKVGAADQAWCVHFGTGYANPVAESTQLRVRCVF